eukprot:Partr_v1_DN27057_c1_g1_i1_m28774 putative PHOsphatase
MSTLTQQQQFHLLNPSRHNAPPALICPFRFATVETGLFRSGQPRVRNFPFLKRLHLKTIISLVPAATMDTEALEDFCRERSITRIHVVVERMKDQIPLQHLQVTNVLKRLIDPAMHPVLVHCLDGSQVTGMVVMCLRKLQLWDLRVAMTEFSRYSRGESASAGPSGDEVEFLDRHGAQALSTTVTVALSSSNISTDASKVDVVQVSPVDSSAALELPSELPRWLWGGQLPIAMLKNLQTLPSPSFTGEVLMQITYAHPWMRIRLKDSTPHLRFLIVNAPPALLSMTTPLEAAKLALSQTPPSSSLPPSAVGVSSSNTPLSIRAMVINERNMSVVSTGISAGASAAVEQRRLNSAALNSVGLASPLVPSLAVEDDTIAGGDSDGEASHHGKEEEFEMSLALNALDLDGL